MSTKAPSVAERRKRGGRSHLPVELEHARAGRIDRGREEAVAERLRVAGADVADRLDARDRSNGVGRRDRDRLEVVLRGDRVAGVVPDLVDGAAERRRDARREHGDERDEREADHQRGCGRGSSLRVPPRVVARQLGRRRPVDEGREDAVPDPVVAHVDPADRRDQEDDPRRGEEPANRRCERLRGRADDPHRQHRDADEDEEGTEAHPDEHAGRAQALAEQPVDHRREAQDGHDQGAERAEAREPALGQRRALTHRRDRLHTRRPERGPEARDEGDEDADEQRDDHRPRREHEAAVRQREADGVEELEQALRQQKAEEQPDDRGERADDERLDDDRAQHLAPAGAERAQRRELARALRDRDRQRVRDHEAADEERDPAEREQEAAQEGDEGVRVLRVLLRLLLTRPRLRVRREHRADLVERLLRRDARLRGDRDLVELAGLVEQPLRGRDVEARERRPSDRGDGAELDQPGDVQPDDRPFRLHPDLVADAEVLLLRRRLVDHHLLSLRPRAVDERQRVEARGAVRDREPEVGGAAEDDRLAVRADQVRLAVDPALGQLHRRERPHLPEHRAPESSARSSRCSCSSPPCR